MKRKAALSAILALLIVTGLFAGGHRETGPMHEEENCEEVHTDMITTIEALEKTTLTGDIHISNRIHPELQVGGETYKLITFPWFFSQEITITDGDVITVEAARVTKELVEDNRFLIPGKITYGNGNEESPLEAGNYLLVTELMVNGKTYKLTETLQNLEGPVMGRRMMHGGFRGKGRMPGWK